MGKRPAAVELFLGDMGSIQWEIQPASQREDLLAMATKLEQIAANLLRPKLGATKTAAPDRSCKRSRAVNQLPKSVVRNSARYVLWESGAGDRLRRPVGGETEHATARHRALPRLYTGSRSIMLMTAIISAGRHRRIIITPR